MVVKAVGLFIPQGQYECVTLKGKLCTQPQVCYSSGKLVSN